MKRRRRSDPYRVSIPWEPASSGLGADFTESLLTGLLAAAVIILADRVILGQWCELPAMGFILATCVLGVWIRTRTRGRVRPSEPVAIDDNAEPVKERVIMVNPPRPEQAAEREEDTRQSELADFVRGCAIDTSLRRWEPSLGREGYDRYRDVLISLGWGAWRSKDRRQGWELTADPGEILDALE